VPELLRQIIGKREIKRTLKTKVPKVALQRAWVIQGEVEKLFQQAMREVGLRQGGASSSSAQSTPMQLFEDVVRWAEVQGFNPMKAAEQYPSAEGRLS
jgi:hypothetical protein